MYVEHSVPHSISLEVKSSNLSIIDDNVVVTIKNQETGKLFNGMFWIDEECTIMAQHIGDGVYEFVFTPDENAVYSITIQSEKTQKSKTYDITTKSPDFVGMVRVSHESIKNNDGTDTSVRRSDGMPLPGTKISAYNSSTKELLGVTQSDVNGHWSMILPTGNYFFIFERENYVQVSIERKVI